MIRPQFILDLNEELIVDNFAGGGGASTGMEWALGRHVDIAINHDVDALALHEANHPQTRHIREDVFKVDPLAVTNGRPVGLAWFSPDCKHFSKAKGGKPVSKKIRGLAWVMVKWAAIVRPRVMVLENVEEFRWWGKVLPNGKPDPNARGKTFLNFVGRLRAEGYEVEWRELRACDYGAPTIRKRLFLIARRDGQPIVWPEPTHGAPASEGVRLRKLKPWRTAAECIDWSLPCPSIFLTRAEARALKLRVQRPLAEATLRRIARGLRRYVTEALDPFIVNYHSAKREGDDRVSGLNRPLPTQDTQNRFGLAVPFVTPVTHAGDSRVHGTTEPLRTVTGAQRGELALVAAHVTKFREGSTGTALDAPLDTVTAGGQPARPSTGNVMGLVSATLVQTGYGERVGQAPRAPGLDKPLGTVVAGGAKHALVSALLSKHYGDQGQRPGSEMTEPVGTVTAKDHHSLIAVSLVNTANSKTTGRAPNAWTADEPLRTVTASPGFALTTASLVVNTSGHAGAAADAPAPTITDGGHHILVASHLSKLYGEGVGASMQAPMPTITGEGNHIAEVRAFLVKYNGTATGADLRGPLHTVVANDRLGLVSVQGQDFQINDVGLRMLVARELYRAQGFPDSYIIDRAWYGTGEGRQLRALTSTAQVRMCGNSVCPPVAAALVAANVPEMAVWDRGERRAAG